jgi:hypothetical protein
MIQTVHLPKLLIDSMYCYIFTGSVDKIILIQFFFRACCAGIVYLDHLHVFEMFRKDAFITERQSLIA